MVNTDLEENKNEVNEETAAIEHKRSNFRSYSAQILASTVKNFLLFNLGMCVAYPAIVIPALHDAHKTAESIYLSDEQITWFGSIAFICQPVGSIFSGWITEPWGRKKAMFLVNIPFIVAWIMMYISTNSTQIFVATVMMGMGVGCMEAAVLTYVGEISQPSIRGLLTSCASLSVALGIFVIFFLGSIVTWRLAALIALVVPVATAVAICFVPETPLWLLSQGRRDEAIKSLQWLRGWTTEEIVKPEFEELERHHGKTDKCASCEKEKQQTCTHSKSSFSSRFGALLTRGTMRPFIIVTLCSLFGHFSGVSAIRQYYIQVYETYDLPIAAKEATVIAGFIGMAGNIVLLLVLKMLGKRKICLLSFLAMGALGITLGFYSKQTLPEGISSFDRTDVPREGKGLIPMIIFFTYAFLFTFGINGIPWMLLSEIFPFKSRGLATGLSAALNYIFAFFATKTYLNVERGFGMHGAAWFYAACSFVGFGVLYYILPETENRTLEEIENHFSTKERSLSDIKIRRHCSLERLSTWSSPDSQKNKTSES